MDYVEVVLKDSVRVVCSTTSLGKSLLSMEAQITPQGFVLNAPSKDALAATMQNLQSLGLHFGDEPAGWPPAAVFQQLRDEGLVSGAIKTVSWAGPGKPIYGQA